MRIRPATTDDLTAVLALLSQDVIREVSEPHDQDPSYAAALAELVAAPHAEVLVGEVCRIDGVEVVATASVYWLRHLTYRGGLVCHVESVRVDANRRGEGLGSELMRHIEELARERRCARLQLTTNAQREAAQRFYVSLGWTPSHVGMKKFLGECA